MQAPTGSNRQGWHWVVVEDAAKKRAICDVYRTNFAEYRDAPAPTYADGDTRGERQPKVADSATYLADNFHRSPLLVIPCLWGRLDDASVRVGASGWGSLLPAVWSFMLALRERGLGSAWTTIHLMNDGEREVAEVLGIPFDKVTQGGLFPVAYTIGTDFRPAASASRSRTCCTGISGSRAPRRGAARSATSRAGRSAARPRTRCGERGRRARSRAPGDRPRRW